MRIDYRRATWPIVMFAIAAVSIGSLTIPPYASACPSETESVRSNEPAASRLPDCRAYEQVSPIAKNTTDASGEPGYVQSSPTGESVTYYSIVPFPGIPGASEFPTYLSMRQGSSWSTQGLLPLAEPDAASEVNGLIEDNSDAFVSVTREEGLFLAPGAQVDEGNFYAHNDLTGGYQLVAAGGGAVTFSDATPDGSHVLFTATGEGKGLDGVADAAEAPFLYEWDRETGQVSFVGEVDGGAPAAGTVPGSNENEGRRTYDQHTISENGSRIYFSERREGEKVYLREPNAGKTVEVSTGPAQWKAATPDGSKAFYTEAGNLYEFEAEGATRKAITSGLAGVLGVLGISQNGSYAYFVAEGILPGENEALAVSGADNLYEWHEGQGATGIRFVARLAIEDESDWRGFVNNEPGASANGVLASRVSPDGTKVLVSSRAKLTGYDNAGHNELYLYDATEPVSTTNPRCVSCNPTGVVATEDAFLSSHSINAAPVPMNSFVTRNMSADGTRIFFQTQEALLPQANGQMNVYEWEQEGVGSCASGEGDGSGGCLYLISTGQSTSESYFGDASATGEDVFFFTRQSLVAQDQDDNMDVYDARVDGGLASQNIVPIATCGNEAECLGAVGTAPVFGAPSSATFSGAGNLAPPTEVKPAVKPKAKPLTRKQKLAAALRACKKKPKKRRAGCVASARKRYGAKSKTSRRGGK
jgi:hypothetical protein